MDSEFDWGDESYVHHLGRGVLVALAFVATALVLAGIAGGLAFLFGNIWVALAVMLGVAGLVELIAQPVRSRRRTE